MTIKKKIEVNVDNFISKGADVNADKNTRDEFSIVGVRLPTDMLNELDTVLEANKWMTRNAWICDAINKKLKEENQRQ